MTNEVFVVQTKKSYKNIKSDLKKLFRTMGLNETNPFKGIINPGNIVLIKPNLVRDYTKGDFSALITNGDFINEVIRYTKLALKGKGKIILGDSPVQDSNFRETLEKAGISNAIDFRREYVEVGRLGITKKIPLERDSEYTIVNLGKNSKLIDIIKDYKRFRVTQYSAKEMQQHHNKEVNEYLIPNYALEADIIINLPKLKTHKKSGFTCSLKNLVGLNGAKAWLPHYRVGSIYEGGDEYLNKSIRKAWISKLIEKRNNTESQIAKLFFYMVEKSIKLTVPLIPFADPYSEGSWFGNWTLPRMVADLNKLIFYADKKGIIRNKKQRKMFIIVDAIISGEGDGPMNPKQKKTGLLIAGYNPLTVDYCCCEIMGLNPNKIPLLNLKKPALNKPLVLYNNQRYYFHKLGRMFDFNFKVPNGWRNCKWLE